MSKFVYSLDKIRRIAEKDECEDDMFFRFLEVKSINDGVDSVILRIYQEVEKQIDCTKCANCCVEVDILISGEDIEDLSKGIGISTDEFKVKYTSVSKWGIELIKPCPFLKLKQCMYYNYRPLICRTYPFDALGETYKLLGSIEMNYRMCPIMFNTYQGLKAYYWDAYEKEI